MAAFVSRVKGRVQWERRRLVNPFLRQRLEDVHALVAEVHHRLADVDQRLALLESQIGDLQRVTTVLRSNADTLAAMALSVERAAKDLDDTLRSHAGPVIDASPSGTASSGTAGSGAPAT